MNSIKINSFVKRFFKGFVSGGFVQIMVIIHQGVIINSWADLKQFGFALGVGFLVGGLLALEKMYSWKE